METGGLNTTTNTGSQSTTQSPQSVGGSSLSSGANSNLQPTPPSNYLNSNNVGVTLTPQALTTVNLNSLSSNQAVQTSPNTTSKHINGGLLIVAILLFFFAVYLFIRVSKTDKNTTD